MKGINVVVLTYPRGNLSDVFGQERSLTAIQKHCSQDGLNPLPLFLKGQQHASEKSVPKPPATQYTFLENVKTSDYDGDNKK